MNTTVIRFKQKLYTVPANSKDLLTHFIGVDVDMEQINFGFLMPIVEKINAMDEFAYCINVYYSFSEVVIEEKNKSVTHQIEGNSMLEAVFNAVMFFIEWYNKNILKI
jgi:hypothetical protein